MRRLQFHLEVGLVDQEVLAVLEAHVVLEVSTVSSISCVILNILCDVELDFIYMFINIIDVNYKMHIASR